MRFQSSEDVGGHADVVEPSTFTKDETDSFNHPKMWGDMPTFQRFGRFRSRYGEFQSSEDVGGHADRRTTGSPKRPSRFQSSEDVGGHADCMTRKVGSGWGTKFQSSEDVGGHADNWKIHSN